MLLVASCAARAHTGEYKSQEAQCAVRCTMRSDEGLLYILDKVLFFLPKPPERACSPRPCLVSLRAAPSLCSFLSHRPVPSLFLVPPSVASAPGLAIALTTLIQYDEIAEIKFERVSKAVSGSFDLVVTKKSGDVVQLTSIRREEFDRMCATDPWPCINSAT